MGVRTLSVTAVARIPTYVRILLFLTHGLRSSARRTESISLLSRAGIIEIHARNHARLLATERLRMHR
jgi:hypothetical protein